MATPIILVHGAWHGAWCWDLVAPDLMRRGAPAVAVNLPSHGLRTEPKADVTMQAYVDDIAAMVDAQDEPVTLVGHSMAGIVVSKVAEMRPDKVKSLVYVAALLVKDNESLMTYGGRDAGSVVGQYQRMGDDGASTIDPEGAIDAFFADTEPGLAKRCAALLEPQTLKVMAEPVRLDAAAFTPVPKVYIRCTRDKAVTLPMQDEMIANWPDVAVETLETDHSPFVSTPGPLAAIIAASAT